MVAITPSTQPTTATVALATLQTVLDGAQAQCPDLASRLDKAAHILATGRVAADANPRIWWVRSETTATTYAVTMVRGQAWHCTCPDHKRRGDWCKHGLAVALLKRCQERQAAPVPLALIPFPIAGNLDPDAQIGYDLTEKALAYLDARPTA